MSYIFVEQAQIPQQNLKKSSLRFNRVVFIFMYKERNLLQQSNIFTVEIIDCRDC